MAKKYTEVSSLHKPFYRQWAGNNRGTPANPDKCCVEVADGGRSPLSHQCNNRRGHGPEEAYCKKHDPAEVKKRDEIRQAKYDEEIRKFRIKMHANSFLDALKQIADGHNDPRTLAKETIANYEGLYKK